jgi:hypothetical protein
MSYDYIQTWIVLLVLAGIGLFALLHHQPPVEKENIFKNSASSTARTFAP